MVLNPMDARCLFWSPGDEVPHEAEALTLAASLFPLATTAGGRRQAKGLMRIRFPVSNSRSLPTHTRREHLPLDASLFYELSFSNFPLLYSSRSGVLCRSANPMRKHRALQRSSNRLEDMM